MKGSPFVRRLVLGMALALLVSVAPGARAEVDHEREGATLDLEQLFRQVFSAAGPKPIYRNLGGGLHSLKASVRPELLARLAESAGSEAGPTLFLLATGQQLTDPTSATALIHAAISDAALAYNYWVAVINTSGQNVNKKTTFKLAGPKGGLKFTKSFTLLYESVSAHVYWFDPGVAATALGIYKQTGQVAGASPASLSTSTFAADFNH